jgi:hypothetical protein
MLNIYIYMAIVTIEAASFPRQTLAIDGERLFGDESSRAHAILRRPTTLGHERTGKK